MDRMMKEIPLAPEVVLWPVLRPVQGRYFQYGRHSFTDPPRNLPDRFSLIISFAGFRTIQCVSCRAGFEERFSTQSN